MNQDQEKYDTLVKELTVHVREQHPPDILQFCADFFFAKLTEQRSFQDECLLHPTEAAWPAHEPKHLPQLSPLSSDDDDGQSQCSLGKHPKEDDEDEDAFEEEDQDVFTGQLPDFSGQYHQQRQRRTSVSAESLTPCSPTKFQKIIHPKTPEQEARIQAAIAHNFLFRHLDEMQYQDVIHAMTEKPVASGETVIQQGDVGDFFYIVESGQLSCTIDDRWVTDYQASGSFGELALMYNSPRAATIVAKTDCMLWALDRVMFRRILMEHTSAKRRMYESFLTNVPILASLAAYERYKIADALESVTFEEGETVIEQGSVGNNFYLIESGEAVCYRLDDQGAQTQVNELAKGGYFGELALLNNSPRAATVVARGRLRCATMNKGAFNRLLGCLHDILQRNSTHYIQIMASTPMA
ncbi:cAMP dependent protein kinase regulatory subunit [Hesseltinella vesiculosa]|uniref:cAMP-dependent protein kinase regulatory subunit n=1 Tax=Hesseltinella vesiculosa TaxID=101127 RepID=A0A1X2GXV6_9FUNG|nr:cAMP dependent protein kinase regulatory subunit [Hesseltinella vesiculosa]